VTAPASTLIALRRELHVMRVFPRRTKATPTDSGAYVGGPDLFAEADEVHVSVTFSWDIPEAERLAEHWSKIAPAKLGGPALGDRGDEFTPGLYLKPGYVFTSRGCPNRCWFCDVPTREGPTRELPICDGWNVLDSNLLACSEAHIRAVFAMLARQTRRVEFTGGLEAARLRDWHVDLLASLHPRPAVWFAYDTPGDLEPLIVAGEKLRRAGFTDASHRVRCYVLIGYDGDTFAGAEGRLLAARAAGFLPMAMLYRGKDDPEPDEEWVAFQRSFARPASTAQLTRSAR
jgi:hypothetical protein